MNLTHNVRLPSSKSSFYLNFDDPHGEQYSLMFENMTDFKCYIESLPPELLLPILTHLPDLDSLGSLLRASPAAYRVFDTRSAFVFKTVLSSGNTHTVSVLGLFMPSSRSLLELRDILPSLSQALVYPPAFLVKYPKDKVLTLIVYLCSYPHHRSYTSQFFATYCQ